VVELRHLRVFAAVAGYRNFGKAAEQLRISQSAVSKAILQLEAEIGTPLLVRSTRSVDLTYAGRDLLQAARDILERVERSLERARRVANGFRGSLAIGYMDIAIIGRLPELISRFTERYPDIYVDLAYSWTDRQRTALRAGDLDIGFVHGDTDVGDFTRLLFSSEGFVIVLPELHPLAKRQSLVLAELAGERFVLGVREEWRPLLDQIRRMCAKAGFVPNVVQEAHFRDALFGFVAAGLGITIYPSSAVNVLRKGVSLVRLDEQSERVNIFMIWNRRFANPALPIFVDFIKANQVST
jgi:DNA-binding transcriptional LysR family regulator